MKGAHYPLGVLCGALCTGRQTPSMELPLEKGTQALVPFAEAAPEQAHPPLHQCKYLDSTCMHCLPHSPFPYCMHGAKRLPPLSGTFKFMHPSVLAPAPLQMHVPPHLHTHSHDLHPQFLMYPHHEHFHDPHMHRHSHMHSHNQHIHSHKHPHIEPHLHCTHLHPPSLIHCCGLEEPQDSMHARAIQSQGEIDYRHMAFHNPLMDSSIHASHTAPAADLHVHDHGTAAQPFHGTLCIVPHEQHDHACHMVHHQHRSMTEAFCRIPAMSPPAKACHMAAVDNAEVSPCCKTLSVVDAPEQTCNMASGIIGVSLKSPHHATPIVGASEYIASHVVADAHAQVVLQTAPQISPGNLVKQTRELHSLWWSSADCQCPSMVETEKKAQTQGADCWQGVSIAKHNEDFRKGASFADKGKKMENDDCWKRATFENKSNENCWKGGSFKKDTQIRSQNCWKGTYNRKQTNAKESSWGEAKTSEDRDFWKGAPFGERGKNISHNAKPWGCGQQSKRKRENFTVDESNTLNTWHGPSNSTKRMIREEPITSKDYDGWGDPTTSNKSAGWKAPLDSKQTTWEIHANKRTIQEEPFSLKACNGWGAPNESHKCSGWEEAPMDSKQTTSKIPVGSKQSTWEEPTGFAKSFGGGPVSLNNDAWEGDQPFGPGNKEEFLTTALPTTFVCPTERNWKESVSPKSKDNAQGCWFKTPADGKAKENEEKCVSSANEKINSDAEGTCLQQEHTSTWPKDSTVGTLRVSIPALRLPDSTSTWGEPSTRMTVEDTVAVPLIEERKEDSLMPDTHKEIQELTATQEFTANMDFLSSSSDDRECEDDLYYESDGEAQHPMLLIHAQSNAKLRENQAYDFFKMIFEESEELRRTYKEEYNVGQFECFVCSGIPNKPLKRYNGLLSVVMHARKILNTKRRNDHRGYARAICDLMGWDANGNLIVPTANVQPRACLLELVGAEQEHKDSDTEMADLENESIVSKDGLGLEFEEHQKGVNMLNQRACEEKIVLKERPITLPSVFRNTEEAYKAFREQVLDKTFGLGKTSFDKDIHNDVEKKYEGKEASGVAQMGEAKKSDVEKNEIEKTSRELLHEDEQLREGQESQKRNQAAVEAKKSEVTKNEIEKTSNELLLEDEKLREGQERQSQKLREDQESQSQNQAAIEAKKSEVEKNTIKNLSSKSLLEDDKLREGQESQSKNQAAVVFCISNEADAQCQDAGEKDENSEVTIA